MSLFAISVYPEPKPERFFFPTSYVFSFKSNVNWFILFSACSAFANLFCHNILVANPLFVACLSTSPSFAYPYFILYFSEPSSFNPANTSSAYKVPFAFGSSLTFFKKSPIWSVLYSENIPWSLLFDGSYLLPSLYMSNLNEFFILSGSTVSVIAFDVIFAYVDMLPSSKRFPYSSFFTEYFSLELIGFPLFPRIFPSLTSLS